MKINKRFLHFKTLNAFQQALSQGIIRDDSIAFIKDAELIWTHGEYYASERPNAMYLYPDAHTDIFSKHIFTTQEIYDNLDSYQKDAIYFILESIPEKEEEETEYGYRFGDKFPIKFIGWSFGGEFPITLS